MAVLAGILTHSNQRTSAAAPAQLLFGADPGRLYYSVANADPTNGVWISGDAAAITTNSHWLPANGHIECTGSAAAAGLYILDAGTNHVLVTYLETTQT
jgi:hypothetical protein